jgi:hypothetical protein
MRSVPYVVDLQKLSANVATARDALARSRGLRSSRDQYLVVSNARRDLITSIEAFHSGLVASGMPIPYRSRDDLRVTRAVERALARVSQTPLRSF